MRDGTADVYRSAYYSGLIELKENTEVYEHITPSPAFTVELTEKGDAETAACTGGSDKAWGLPYATRELISVSFDSLGPQPDTNPIYTVDFKWQPTEWAERLKYRAPDSWRVEEGNYRTRVYFRRLAGKWRMEAMERPVELK